MTTALIDGDVFVYRAAARAERIWDWDDDVWSVIADLNEAKGHFHSEIAQIKQALNADEVVLCVSDPAGTFRHGMFPTYKAHRNKTPSTRKPLVFRALREWTVEKQGAIVYPALEADDVLGILATSGEGKKVVVTIDKDLKSVPGLHYNPDKSDLGVVEITPEEAEKFHLCQTIAGDPTDGFPGVPGLGMVRAARLLEKDGWTWETVVKAYESKDLTEHDALLNARLAKILTAAEWDPAEQKVIHWVPKVAAV